MRNGTSRGLVQEQDAGLREQLRGDADAPPLAAGQAPRKRVADEAVRDLQAWLVCLLPCVSLVLCAASVIPADDPSTHRMMGAPHSKALR